MPEAPVVNSTASPEQKVQRLHNAQTCPLRWVIVTRVRNTTDVRWRLCGEAAELLDTDSAASYQGTEALVCVQHFLFLLPAQVGHLWGQRQTQLPT